MTFASYIVYVEPRILSHYLRLYTDNQEKTNSEWAASGLRIEPWPSEC
jgi:hypothetical protein